MLRNCSTTVRTPRRPFEKERLDEEMKLVGQFGLKNKREVWRVQTTLTHLRARARDLLTLEEKDPQRIFEGDAMLRRLHRSGILPEDKNLLDYVLAIKEEDLLARRLQTLVYKLGLAKSIHHARVLIRQRHIRVGSQVVNVPSFIVRVESERHIGFTETSSLGGGRPGRNKRKTLKKTQGEGGEDEEL